jgi:hypothetical protein
MAGLGWARLWGGLVNVIAVMVYLVMISPVPGLIGGREVKDRG